MSAPQLMKHTHSKWERCSWSDFRCPVFYTLKDVWEGRLKVYFPDSTPRDIVINGVVFKQ